MQFGISELISEIGNDDIAIQFLTVCATGIKTKKNGESTVTFITDAINATDVATDSGKVGIIVWADRDSYDKAVVKLRQLATGDK
jgi:hypothetical protein